MMYKIGDIFATKTYGGQYYLNQITYINEFESGGYALYCDRLYNDNLLDLGRFNNTGFSIILPEQEDGILPKEEFFNHIQKQIDEKQDRLNSIKETYDN